MVRVSAISYQLSAISYQLSVSLTFSKVKAFSDFFELLPKARLI